jgi:hypothetical protein
MAEREYERDEAGRFGTGTGGGGGASGTATVEPPAGGGGAVPLAPLSERADQNIRALEDRIRGQDFETAAAVAADGTPIMRKDGEADRVDFNAAEVRSLEGAVFTHNHPRGDSFSAEDIRMSGIARLAEMRATTRDGTTYRIQPAPGRTWPAGDQLRTVTDRVREETRLGIIAAVHGGALSREQGAIQWSHETWTRAAPELGLIYSRER